MDALGALVSPLGMSHQTPVSSQPRSLYLRGILECSQQKEFGAPALGTGPCLLPPVFLLPAAEKQERVITFEFLPFAFNSLPPQQRSPLKTGSVYKAVLVFLYHCRSLEDSRDRCLLLGAFIILTLTMAREERRWLLGYT